MAPQLLFVIGASGAGKTAALRVLNDRSVAGISCHHFDSVAVPSPEDMTRICGSPQRWQEVTTHQWVTRLQSQADPIGILEGQTRPSFIRDALAGTPAGIVLLDCSAAARSDRLRNGRHQPELDAADMQSWAAYLRGQADALSLPVIDTTLLSLADVAERLLALARTLPEWASA